MSAIATPSMSGGQAPWRTAFLSHLAKMVSPEFVLTSLHAASPTDSAASYVPRARTCVFRGLWARLPENKYNQAPRNDQVYDSDLLTITTDVRMSKIPEIFASAQDHSDLGQSQGSGGGGPVEAVFWVKDVMTQWRFRGEAYVVGPDIEGVGEGARIVRSKVGDRMKVIKEAEKESWSWARELTAHFGNLSPGMRGSFANPPPGTPISIPPGDKSMKLGQKIDDLHHEAARKNFRVVIIKPDEVEELNLTNPDQARRWKYTYVEEQDSWTKEELWP